ncbi:hypothetical protein I4U23_008425 [Adineta vaga]|nr:hypothetical protein I4U23_008425 [Adineta vaga]
MNQLQVLLHTALIDSGHIEKCGLLIRDTSQIKTTSVGYKLEQTDVDTLVNAFNQPTLLRKKGLYFNETYYTCIRTDNESIYAKENNRGLIVVKTKVYILFGTFNDRMNPAIAIEAVEKLGEYFKAKEE